MISSSLHILKLFTLIMILSTMSGCASVTMPPPAASSETLKNLRAAKLATSSVGEFGIAQGAPPEIDKSLGGLRGMSLRSSTGSFAQQLRDTVIVELKAAGLYNETSELEIEGQLVESKVDAAITTGRAKLAANFTVDKSGLKIFEKLLSVESEWDSSFIGDIAVPEAINQYNSLYKELVAKLFNDREFQAALALE